MPMALDLLDLLPLIFLSEAGGRIVCGNPGDWDTPLDSRVYLAVRGGEGQEQFIKDFWSHIKGNLEYEH